VIVHDRSGTRQFWADYLGYLLPAFMGDEYLLEGVCANRVSLYAARDELLARRHKKYLEPWEWIGRPT